MYKEKLNNTSVVSQIVHRIHHACLTWENTHLSFTKAKEIFESNQYPSSFHDKIKKMKQDKFQQPKPDVDNKVEKPVEKKLSCVEVKLRNSSNVL